LEAGVEKAMKSGGGAGVERAGLEVSGRLKSALPSEALPSTARSPKLKKGFSKERVEAVLKSGGKLSRADLLLCRVRWFSDGVAIGSKGFVEGVFNGCRSYFGAKRKDGARKIREDAAGSLHALRELRLRAVD
jgi:hypothetical protein